MLSTMFPHSKRSVKRRLTSSSVQLKISGCIQYRQDCVTQEYIEVVLILRWLTNTWDICRRWRRNQVASLNTGCVLLLLLCCSVWSLMAYRYTQDLPGPMSSLKTMMTGTPGCCSASIPSSIFVAVLTLIGIGSAAHTDRNR